LTDFDAIACVYIGYAVYHPLEPSAFEACFAAEEACRKHLWIVSNNEQISVPLHVSLPYRMIGVNDRTPKLAIVRGDCEGECGVQQGRIDCLRGSIPATQFCFK
jgi:hypothetical protein